MVARPKTRMTVPEFFAWWDDQATDERFELVDGEVVGMTRDRVAHNETKIRTVLALRRAIEKAGVDCRAFIDGLGVSPNERNFRLPDAVVNCGPVDNDAALLPNPVIVVEVVSPRSEGRDVHEKLADYFGISSIMHYLIIYPERGYVVHHGRAALGKAVQTSFVREGVLELTPPGLELRVGELIGEAA